MLFAAGATFYSSDIPRIIDIHCGIGIRCIIGIHRYYEPVYMF